MTIETASGEAVSLDRAPGGLQAVRRARDGAEQRWTVLGASRGEGGILGEGVRQALLRDPTYRPALAARRSWSRDEASRSLDDPAAAVADLLSDAAAAGGHIVLTGGCSPKRAYELAAARDADWSGATVWFSDERCVPPDHEWSNYGDGRGGAAVAADRAARRCMRMQGELGPSAGADAYEALVRERLGDEPRWDLLLLGLGPDAHTASLFPGKPEVDVTDRLVVGVPEAGMEPQVPRISLTLPAHQRRRARSSSWSPARARREARAAGVRRPAGPVVAGRARAPGGRRADRVPRPARRRPVSDQFIGHRRRRHEDRRRRPAGRRAERVAPPAHRARQPGGARRPAGRARSSTRGRRTRGGRDRRARRWSSSPPAGSARA